jgi:hypothetical protein
LFHALIHFLSFLLKINVAFAAYATAKKRPFSQNFLGSAAVLFRPATRRDFAPPFTAVTIALLSLGFLPNLWGNWKDFIENKSASSKQGQIISLIRVLPCLPSI